MVDKTVVKVLQAGLASITGGGVCERHGTDERRRMNERVSERHRTNRWMRKGDTVHTLACVQHVHDTRDKSTR